MNKGNAAESAAKGFSGFKGFAKWLTFAFTFGVACAVWPFAAGAVVGSAPGQFSVSPTGAATYQIPIDVPPGVNGLKPSLALLYNSQAGSGLLGQGWSLSGLSAVSRCPQTLDTDNAVHLPDLSSDDRFCLDGQRLVLTGGSPYGASGTTYHTEIESFQQATVSTATSTGPTAFTIVDRSGLTRTYGQVNGGSCILASDGKTCVMWPVTEITDHYGNFIKFYYDIGFSDYLGGAQPGAFGLKEIDYGNAQGAIVGRVQFTYDNGSPGRFRGDSYTSYFAGTSITHNPVALTNIIVENGNGDPLRKYYLNYTYGNTIPGSKPATTLNSLQECNGGGNCFPPTTFTYDGSPTAFNLGGDEITQGLPTGYIVGDFDGDGFPDYVYVKNSALYVVFGDNLNTPIQVAATVNDNSTPGIDLIGATPIDLKGDGKQELLVQYFANPGITPDLPTWDVLVWNGQTGTNANLSLQSAPTTDGSPLAVCQLGNNSCEATVATALSATGNGADGLLYTDDGKLYYYPNVGGALKSTPAPTNISYTDINAKPPALVPINYSGEGQAEVYVAGNGVIRWNPSTNNFYMEQYGNFDDANNMVLFVNANGDGLSSAVVVVGSSVCVSANTGYGFSFSSADPTLFNNCATISGLDTTQLQAIDWFGDGRQEVIAPVNGTWYLFEPDVSGFAYSVSTGITVSGTPTRFLDVNGDGRADMLYPYNGHTEIYYNAFSPYLLNEVTNGFGHHTDVGYIPLDQATHKVYVTSVASPLINAPHIRQYMGPMYIVNDYAVDTGLFDSSNNPEQIYTNYIYGGAAIDQWGRGFLGFSRVEAVNYNTGIYTDVVYNQDFPFAGTVQSSTKSWNQNASLQSANVGSGGVKVTCNHLVAGEPDCEVTSTSVTTAASFTTGGQVLSSTTNTYKDDVSTYPGVYYPYVSLSTTQLTEIKASSPYETTTTTTKYGKVSGSTITPIGVDVMPTDITVTTTPGSGSSSGPATVDTVTTYGQESTCPGRATGIQVTNTFDGTTEPVKSESFTYDADCFLTQDTKTIFDPSGSRPDLQLTKKYVPDSFGNPVTSTVSGTDVASRQTSTTYDSQGLFPISIANSLGQTETLASNDWGQTLTDTDANGNTVSDTYDGFGRKLKQSGPMPKVVTTWAYAACNLPCAYEVFESNSADTSPGVPDGNTPADSATEYDQLGRVIKTLKTAFDGGVTEQDTQYDLLGRVTQASKPYRSGGTPCFDFKTYDVLNRVVSDVAPATAAVCGATPPTTSARTLTIQYKGLTTIKAITAPSASIPSEQTTTISNVLGKPDSVTDAGGTTQYTYDAWGNLISVTPPDGNTVTMSYDSVGDKLSMHDPDMGAWSYVYDALGELLTQTDAKGQTVTNSYDALGRLVTRSEAEGVTTWKYDIAYGAGIGRLAYTVGPNGVWEGYAYDAYGNTTDKITVVNGQEYWVTNTYDNQGRVSQIVYPNLTAINVNAAPATPSGLGATIDADDNAQIDLTWTLAQNGQIYHLYRTLSSASAPTDADEIYSGPNANWADNTITSNGTYEWWLKACNDTNCSGYTTVTLAVTLPPTVPALLSVPSSDTHNRSVTLNWSQASLVSTTAGPISYLLEEEQVGSKSTFGPATTVSATTDTVTLNTNATYAFRVRACASSSCSAWQYSADYKTVLTPGNPGTPTSAPASVTPTSSPASYTVSWSTPGFVGGPVNYELQEENTLDASPQFVDVTPSPGSNSSEPVTKSKDGKYLYQVRACDQIETAVCSVYVVANAPTPVTLPPTDPGIPVLPSSDTHNWAWSIAFNQSTLNSGSSGAITYQLQQSWNGGSWTSVSGPPYISSVDGTVSFNAVAVEQSGIFQDGTYTYRARACTTDTATGGTACSSYVPSAGGYVTVIAPGAPASLTVPSNSNLDGSFTVTYTAPAAGTGGAADSYKVSLGDTSCDPNLGCTTYWVDGHCASTTLSCTFTAGQIANGTYKTRIEALNSGIGGTWLTTGSVTVYREPAPAAPSLSGTTTTPTGSVSLSWSAPTNATSYKLYAQYYSLSSGSWSSYGLKYSGSNRSWSQTLTSDQKYAHYYVVACDVSGCSGASNVITTTHTPPAAPGLTGPSNTDTGSVALSWSVPSGTTSFDLYASYQSRLDSTWTAYALIYSGGSSTHSYTATIGVKKSAASYYVIACGVMGCSGHSNTLTVTYNLTGGTSCGQYLCFVLPDPEFAITTDNNLPWVGQLHSMPHMGVASLSELNLHLEKSGIQAIAGATVLHSVMPLRMVAPVTAYKQTIFMPLPVLIKHPVEKQEILLARNIGKDKKHVVPTALARNLGNIPHESARVAFFRAHDSARQGQVTSGKPRMAQGVRLALSTGRYTAAIDPRLSAYPPLRRDPRVAAHFEVLGGVLPAHLERVDCGTTDSDTDCSEPAGSEALMVGYVYSSVGYLAEVQKLDSGGHPVRVLWQATDMTAAGQVDQESFDAAKDGTGAAFAITDTYDAASGLLTGTTATTTQTTGDTLTASYSWDGYNNLLTRAISETVGSGQTASPALSEGFSYDNLNQLTHVDTTVGSNSPFSEDDHYLSGVMGGFNYKGSYTNYQYDPAHPHAVASLTTPKGLTRTFSYDANGNLVAEGGDVNRSVTWTSYNKPSQITGNGATDNFLYGPSRERLMTQVVTGTDTVTTTYIDGLFEQVYDSASGTTTYKHYILAGGARVGTETLTADSAGQVTADTLSFYVHDEVGSVIATVIENLGGSNQTLTLSSYDAWGKARPNTGTTAYQDPDPGIYLNPTQAGQHEGYADHENLDDVGLVDMEGRVYDPEVGRFLSPDPNVQYPDSSQGYDRYTYVNDNPLSFSDPSGYFMLGGLFATGDPLAAIYPQQYGQVIGTAGPIVGAALNDVPYCEVWCDEVVTAVSQAQAGYLETGNIGAGLKAGAIAGAEAYAFSYVGGQFGANPEGGALLERSVIEGVIGGTFSAAGGGRFSDGFLGSFASSETASWVDNIAPSNEAARVVMSAVLGGTVSKLSGGNFAHGAVAAAFQRLFNDELHRIQISKAERARIKVIEGLKLTLYEDPPGSGKYSIGYGTQMNSEDKWSVLCESGGAITVDQANKWFDESINNIEEYLTNVIHVPLSQNQADALGDYIYNVGSLGPRFLNDVNSGAYWQATWELNARLVNGQVNDALWERRIQEQMQFVPQN